MPKKGSAKPYIYVQGAKADVERCTRMINQLVRRGFCALTHPDTFEETIRVPEKKQGFVIGPKGDNIKAIQNATGCKLKFPERGSGNDQIQILGDKDACKVAKEAIRNLIENGYSSLTHPDQMHEEIDFPSDMLRKLIGPRGQTIKSIQGNTGTKINTPDAGSNSPVSIVGTPEGIAAAKRAIDKLLEPEAPPPEDPDWADIDPDLDEW
jgi:rRNA processing protein Krr1/Pno1